MQQECTRPSKGTLVSDLNKQRLKVLGHGHVFEVGILISSGSDIRFDWPTVGRTVHRAGRLYTTGAIWDTLGNVTAVLSLLQDFVHVSLAAETS